MFLETSMNADLTCKYALTITWTTSGSEGRGIFKSSFLVVCIFHLDWESSIFKIDSIGIFTPDFLP